VLLVANDHEKLSELQVPVIPDALPAGGAPFGIYPGPQAMRQERGVFFAREMPLLNRALPRHMICLSHGYDAVALHIDPFLPQAGRYMR